MTLMGSLQPLQISVCFDFQLVLTPVELKQIFLQPFSVLPEISILKQRKKYKQQHNKQKPQTCQHLRRTEHV